MVKTTMLQEALYLGGGGSHNPTTNFYHPLYPPPLQKKGQIFLKGKTPWEKKLNMFSIQRPINTMLTEAYLSSYP